MAIYNNPCDGEFTMLPYIPEEENMGWDLMWFYMDVAQENLDAINNGTHRLPSSFSFVKDGLVDYAIIKVIQPPTYYKVVYAVYA
jgi:hypothetical protein